MEVKYNTRSPAVKRLMREAAELAEATSDYYAAPLEDNLFEWHFTVRGPDSSPFQGGVYHGRILVPPEYPMKPPDIILLTPNGRFVVGKKICLSISGFHPESWQPSWSIRTALLAIIGFMPSQGMGTIGSLDYSKEERMALAKRSKEWSCDVCGPTSSLLAAPTSESNPEQQEEVKDILQNITFKSEEEILQEKKQKAAASCQPGAAADQSASTAVSAATGVPVAASATSAAAARTSSPAAARTNSPAARTNSPTAAAQSARVAAGVHTDIRRPEILEESSRHFSVYDYVIMGIVAIIGILLVRRVSLMQHEDSEGPIFEDD